ncbi:MAG: hypothetical protein AAGB93_23980 [Planctomycetota bacterium]
MLSRPHALLRPVSLLPGLLVVAGTLVLLAAAPSAGAQDGESTSEPEVGDRVDAAAKRALEEAPPRGRIGRMRGFQSVSRVVFVALPDDPHRLTFSAAFPDRTRLALSSDGGHRQVMRLGDAWFGHDQERVEQRPSYLLEGEGRDETRLDFALRRALFLWPDGATFVGEGLSRTSKVGDVGVLLVQLDRGTERPASIRAFDRKGRSAAEVRDIEWREEGGRAWPARFTFLANGQPLWTEEVERVRPDFLFTDTMFLPGDRVGRLVGESHGSAVRARFLDGAWIRSVALAPGTRTDEAADRALVLWATLREDLAKRGVELGLDVGLELDGDRRPVAVQLEVLESPSHDAVLGEDSDWERRDPTEAWTFRCAEVPSADHRAYEAVEEPLTERVEPIGEPMIRLLVRAATAPKEQARWARVEVVQAFRVRAPRRTDPVGR